MDETQVAVRLCSTNVIDNALLDGRLGCNFVYRHCRQKDYSFQDRYLCQERGAGYWFVLARNVSCLSSRATHAETISMELQHLQRWLWALDSGRRQRDYNRCIRTASQCLMLS
jgi:hypothetical protein